MTPALILVGLLALLVALAWLGQRSLIYFPSDAVPAPPAHVQEVALATSDGLQLRAWLVPAVGTDVPASTIVAFHGNAGNRAGRLSFGEALAARGHDVLLVDYRGYGGNAGAPSSDGLALDADAAYDWLQARDEGSGPVVWFGESVGAGVAIDLATRHAPDALVLRSPFTSLAELAQFHHRIVPGAFLRDSWPNLDRIATIDVPVLVVAGDVDRIVPLDQSRRVADAAAGPSEFVVVPGVGHNDRALLDGDQLVDAVDGFLTTHLG